MCGFRCVGRLSAKKGIFEHPPEDLTGGKLGRYNVVVWRTGLLYRA